MPSLHSIFYDGDLQSDDGDEGNVWQNQFLNDQNVLTALSAKAVVLRIRADSQEAQQLSTYYPIPKVPSFIIIFNGCLILDVRAGETKSAFKAAILKSLSMTLSASESMTKPYSDSRQSSAASNSSSQSGPKVRENPPDNTPIVVAGPSNTAAPSESIQAQVFDPSEGRNNRGQGTLISSSGRGPADEHLLSEHSIKQEKKAAEKAERIAKIEARKAAVISNPESAKAKRVIYDQKQKQQKSKAKLERDRIVRQIELDKIERREKEERGRLLATAEAQKQVYAYDQSQNIKDVVTERSLSGFAMTPESRSCALQVRLFDGSIIRQKFPCSSTLRDHVREWVDESRSDGDAPYTFKHLLVPMPNRTLSVAEEEESLLKLGMMPSSTLILVPIRNYIAAYSAHRGYLPRVLSAIYSVVILGVGMIASALGVFLGLGQQTSRPSEGLNEEQERERLNTEQIPSSTLSGDKVRTFRHQRNDQDAHQLYNGNQLNFEPQKDDKDQWT